MDSVILFGGALLLMIMSTVFTPQFLIPAHGVVQIGSNLSRVVLNFKNIDWKIIFNYLIGAVLGAVLGTQLDFKVPETLMSLVLGSFIIFATWFPLQRIKSISLLQNYTALGFLSVILSLFVGLAGLLIHPFILKEKHLNRFGFIGTEAFCAGFTHILKVLVFSLWGFSVLKYWKILLLMILATFLGSFLGKATLKRISEKNFKIFIKILISLLAIRLIVKAMLI